MCRDAAAPAEEQKVRTQAENSSENRDCLDTMSTQLVPILDRTGRLMIDLAHVIKPSTPVAEGEINVAAMPTPRELALMNPRSLSTTEVHVYNLNTEGEAGSQVTRLPAPPASSCGNQLS